jgi:hypothetical protein
VPYWILLNISECTPILENPVRAANSDIAVFASVTAGLYRFWLFARRLALLKKPSEICLQIQGSARPVNRHLTSPSFRRLLVLKYISRRPPSKDARGKISFIHEAHNFLLFFSLLSSTSPFYSLVPFSHKCPFRPTSVTALSSISPIVRRLLLRCGYPIAPPHSDRVKKRAS